MRSARVRFGEENQIDLVASAKLTEGDGLSRKRVNLKTLPAWLQYLIALAVIAAVAAAAWIVGKDKAIPSWITNYLIPILGWSYIVLALCVIVSGFLKRWRA
jgi:hypothetical protein